MPTIHPFHVVPALPEPLLPLRTLAFNLRWAWDHETVEVFQRLDRELWERTEHNPVRMLGTIAQDRLQDAAQDDTFLAQMGSAERSLELYLKSKNTWYLRKHASNLPPNLKIAYFSMEFGITECLPIYSGGLGVLAGDHLKSSSDLGLPLVAVGLLYQQGYFRQRLSADGWQQERYPENDFYNLPIQPVLAENGKQLTVSVDFPGRVVQIQIWKAQVGRVPLYLLDTNTPENRAEDHNITDQLYGGDVEMRIKQEIVLGIGGIRTLQAMGIKPTICHMNEGHAAFLGVERVRTMLKEYAADYWQAQEASAAGNLFTTHTPVPAGFDVFTSELLQKYFSNFYPTLGISQSEFEGLGRVNSLDSNEPFNMAMLAMRHAHQVNGVSKLHGKVTRKMVQNNYPGFPEDEVPVGHVTNGIHTRSVISREMTDLFDHYLGGRWSQDITEERVWSLIDTIPDEEIWRVRERCREQLVNFTRLRLRQQYQQRNMSEHEIRQAREVLNPDALTIGFARRFATYKRATLLFADVDRLSKLVGDAHRPVQILLAGKAHPRDDGGKELIRQIVQFARREDLRNRIVFLEDYDIALARKLVQGVDVWLNNPRMLMEASGTSGMKVLPNGGLNVSIPDGWWAEGYDSRCGWSIGTGELYPDPATQDKMESQMLYDILEKEVVPLFYDRSVEGMPRAWIARIKNSMKLLCPFFNTHRMVADYAEKYYFPATHRYNLMMDNELEQAKNVVAWKRKMGDNWHLVRLEKIVTNLPTGTATQQNGAAVQSVHVGDGLAVTVYISLGNVITPDDVSVEVMHGALDSQRQIVNPTKDTLHWIEKTDGLHCYKGNISCTQSGLQGFTVRILPKHSDVSLPQELSLICWG